MISPAQSITTGSWMESSPAHGESALDLLFAPLDVRRAYRVHRANCGPASFAALVGRNVCDIMNLFPNFPEKPYTNIPRMHAALRETGIAFRRDSNRLPSDGLALLQT